MVLLAAPAAMADTVIDFETPEVDLVDPLELTTSINGVTFWLEDNGTLENAWLHEVDDPQTAFVDSDNPNAYVGVGDQFLGDTRGANRNPKYNLLMGFDTAVTSLSLDLYDYGDWLVSASDEAYLFVYSDAAWTNVIGFTSVAAGGSDATKNLALDSFGAAKSAALVFIDSRGSHNFSTGGEVVGDAFDGGWGVDNVTFSVVPEPATMSLLGLGVLGMAARHIRRKRS
jgi:hypothetical protein